MNTAGDRSGYRRRLTWALGIAAAYMGAEIVGGLLANSLALLADAAHMATDVAGLAIALWAMRLADRAPTEKRTYGYHRAEILAAAANGAVLVAVTFYLLFEAYRRFQSPQEVVGTTMLAVAAGGLAVNAVGLWLLRGSGRDESLNVRGAWLQVLKDTLGSVAVIIGAILVWAFDWWWADPAAGALIGFLVLYAAWSLLRDSVDVLMESVPEEIELAELRDALRSVDGVQAVHDLHVWELTSGVTVLTGHVVIEEPESGDRILTELSKITESRFGIDHSTLQLENRSRVGDETDL